MKRVLKVLMLGCILLGIISNVNGQKRVGLVPTLSEIPKRIILGDEFIKVNSSDTIFVQTIQFPLMSDKEKVFVGKKISDYRSSKIKIFIDSFFNRDRVSSEYFQEFSYFQKWRFEIVNQSQTEFSFKLRNYEFTGGAHGNTTVKSFNLDLTNMKSYKFEDKFKGLDINKLAEYCTNYCNDKDIPIFDNKIKATPELLSIWNFTKEGLLLTFQQYSIAPYSSGVIEIHIPKKELDKLIINN